MRNFLITFLILISALFSQETIYGTIEHDGLQREYILYVPSSYTVNQSVPLLFNFHGYTSNANVQMYYGSFRSIADTAGFIIIHPQGTLDNQGITFWNVGWGTEVVDDVGFTEAMIDSIGMEYNIDLERVYATGMSNGGFMSFHLACQLSEKIAAVASVTGSMTPFTFNNCNPQHPTPILQIHGTADNVVPYNGAITWTLSIEDVLQSWVNYNNCDTSATITNLPNINPYDGSTVELIIYDEGDNGVTVEHFKVIGGGHTWPGTAFGSPGTNYDINASVEIWKFFSKYDINGLIGTAGIDEEAVPASFTLFPAYPNPFNPVTTLRYDLPEQATVNIIIYDMLGREVKTLVNTTQNAGFKSVIWDATNNQGNPVSAGVYLYQIRAGKFVQTKKVVLLK